MSVHTNFDCQQHSGHSQHRHDSGHQQELGQLHLHWLLLLAKHAVKHDKLFKWYNNNKLIIYTCTHSLSLCIMLVLVSGTWGMVCTHEDTVCLYNCTVLKSNFNVTYRVVLYRYFRIEMLIQYVMTIASHKMVVITLRFRCIP